MSYNVLSLFTNVPVDETVEILAEKAFTDDWFDKDLNITNNDLIELLEVATENQPFQLEGNLYKQVDEVAMGSLQNKMPAFYTEALCRRHPK